MAEGFALREAGDRHDRRVGHDGGPKRQHAAGDLGRELRRRGVELLDRRLLGDPDLALGAFERGGGTVIRTRGSHCLLRMPNGETLAVPLHKELKVGLLLHLVRRAGMTPEAFRAFLERG